VHPLSPEAFLEECIAFKREHQARSRFMHELIVGKLAREQVACWASDFYWYVEPAIPSVAAWLASAPTLPDRRMHRMIARNLAGEMGFLREAEHHELYLQFLREGFDISYEAVLATLPTPGTVGAAAAVGYYCRSSFLEGVGGFGLAVEMEVPGTAKAGQLLLDALGRHYGISRHALEFFEVHIEAEDEHGGNAVDVLRLCAQTAEQQVILRRAFRFSVLAHRGMREGYDRFLAR